MNALHRFSDVAGSVMLDAVDARCQRGLVGRHRGAWAGTGASTGTAALRLLKGLRWLSIGKDRRVKWFIPYGSTAPFERLIGDSFNDGGLERPNTGLHRKQLGSRGLSKLIWDIVTWQVITKEEEPVRTPGVWLYPLHRFCRRGQNVGWMVCIYQVLSISRAFGVILWSGLLVPDDVGGSLLG